MGCGYLPSRTPAHQLDLLIGKGPPGAMIDFKRTSPEIGKLLELLLRVMLGEECK